MEKSRHYDPIHDIWAGGRTCDKKSKRGPRGTWGEEKGD